MPLPLCSTYVPPREPQEYADQLARGRVASLIDRVPNDVLGKIFECLSGKDLCQADAVCKHWNKAVSQKLAAGVPIIDLSKRVLCSVTVLDGAVWKAHTDLKALGLEVCKEKPLVVTWADVLFLRKFASRVEGNAGITILTMPKGLTLNKLRDFAAAPIKGNATGFKWAAPSPIEKLGDAAMKKTIRVVITNSIFADSRNLSVANQQQIVEEMGCEMPNVLSIAALIFLTYVSSRSDPSTRLYNDTPRTSTRCKERVDRCLVSVGSFMLEGLHLHHRPVHDYDWPSIGIAGQLLYYGPPLPQKSD